MVAGDQLKRQRLRVALKLMLLIAVGFIVLVSMQQFSGQSDFGISGRSQVKDLSDVKPGTLISFLWEDRPVLVYRRTSDDIDRLIDPSESMSKLVDPDSKKSLQPEFAKTALRSFDREWFVAINQGTDFGCTLQLVDLPSVSLLRDTCRGSDYDLAGRVLSGHYATKNISIPQYTMEGETLILGGN